MIVLGYCAVIAIAQLFQWSWLLWWLELWTPVVDGLRKFIPIFNNSESALTAKGLGHRISVIHHLLAVCWILESAILIISFLAVCRLSREEWIFFAKRAPKRWLVAGVFGGGVFFLFALSWVVIGYKFTSENILFAWHRYDLPLIGIGAMFYGVQLFGIGFQVCVTTLIVGNWFKPKAGSIESISA